jgi:hypothetical protein
VDMTGYTMKTISDLPEYFNGLAATPARNDLFSVDLKADDLTSDDADAFHTLVAKLLFLCLRARPDILTAVSFLCTRVAKPTVQDKGKLKRVIQYLRNWPNLNLTLEAESLSVVKWWVDGSFAVHPDMRSHTGGMMSMGKGSIISMSTKQKLNTKSSTEDELVAVDDAMPRLLWTRYFSCHRAMLLSLLYFIKTIKVQSSLKRTVMRQAVKERDISIFDTTSSQIESKKVK